MRFLLRLASAVVLFAAVLAGAVDAIQSVAASELVMTSLGDDLEALGADTASWIQFAQRSDTAQTIWHSVLHWLLMQPAFAVLAPRFWAGVISVPLLTAMFSAVGILGGYLIGVGLIGVDEGAIDARSPDQITWLAPDAWQERLY